MYRRISATVALCFALSAQTAVPHQSGSRKDQSDIRQVVETFRKAIINKDKSSYMNLFFSAKPEEVGWQAVVDDEKLTQIKLSKPQAIKARRIPANNFISLIDSVVSSKSSEEEQISNLSIDTDGEIASVAFDYSYVTDSKMINWGKEQWQLVRTESGWKIFSVVYTIRNPAR